MEADKPLILAIVETEEGSLNFLATKNYYELHRSTGVL